MDLFVLASLSRLVAFSIFTIYLIGIVSKYGILTSISDSDYFLEKKWGFLFEIVLIICGVSLILSGIEFKSIFILIGGIGFCGVGFFPRFRKNKRVRIIHYICAIIGYFSSILGIILLSKNSVLLASIVLAAFIVFILTKNRSQKYIWNTEVALAYSIFISIELIKLFLYE